MYIHIQDNAWKECLHIHFVHYENSAAQCEWMNHVRLICWYSLWAGFDLSGEDRELVTGTMALAGPTSHIDSHIWLGEGFTFSPTPAYLLHKYYVGHSLVRYIWYAHFGNWLYSQYPKRRVSKIYSQHYGQSFRDIGFSDFIHRLGIKKQTKESSF
jgi:hypothetical protein